MSNDEILTFLLSKVPNKYESAVVALSTLNEAELTIDKVRSRLLEEELKKNDDKNHTDPTISAAFKTQTRIDQKYFTKIRCYNCNQIGHKANKCPKPPKKKSSDGPPHKLACVSQRTSNSQISDAHEINFLLDCACTDHLINDEQLLSDKKKIAPFEIQVAKQGETLKISTAGALPVLSFGEGRKVHELNINNVCHAPELTHNLLSVSKLDDAGFKIVIENGTLRVVKNNIVVFKSEKQAGMYPVTFSSRKHYANATIGKRETSMLWHRRLAHLGMSNVYKMSKGLVKGMPNDISGIPVVCECCIKSKQTRQQFGGTRPPTQRPLERIHSDLCGPFEVETHDGYRYFATFMDDFTHFSVIFLLKFKSELWAAFKKYHAMANTRFNRKIEHLRCDQGGEYTSNQLRDYAVKNGITLEYTAAYNPELNGVAERLNRTLCEKVRAMLNDSNLDRSMWGEAVLTAMYLTNRSPTEALKNKTPFEMWYDRSPILSHLRVFGSRAFAHIPKQNRQGKLSDRSSEYIMVGYTNTCYRLFDKDTGHIVAKRHVVFDETMQGGILTTNPQNKAFHHEESKDNDSRDVENTSVDMNQKDQLTVENPSCVTTNVNNCDTAKEVTTETIPLNDSPVMNKRITRRPEYLNDYECEGHMAFFTGMPQIPKSFQDVVGRDDETEWRRAIQEEIVSLEKNETWDVVKPERGAKVISSRWIFKKKPDITGNSTRYKARLVAKGYMQRQGQDYEETYSPVARLATIRLLMSVAVKFRFKMHHLDVVTAFLHGNLTEDVFMRIPEGINISEGNVLRLKKSLYGLKQSPKCWNDRFHSFITKLKFERSNADYCLYTRTNNSSIIYLIIYVDDMIITGNDEEQIADIKRNLFDEFDMKDLGIVKQFMGLNVDVDVNGSISIDQSHYIDAILERFGMSDCNSSPTPMIKNLKLTKGTDQQTNLPYRELLGSLMYLMLGSRPDICFALSYLSRFQDCATDEHYQHLKRLLRYLKGTSDFKLNFSRNDEDVLTGYADADWANDSADRKSTSGYIFKVFGNVVNWGTKKQGLVTLSTCEAEFVAACTAASEALWMKKVICDMKLQIPLPIKIFEDNLGTIMISKNHETRRSKHIDTKFHFLRELTWDGIIKLEHVSSQDQLADIFTKALDKQLHEKFLRMMCLHRGRMSGGDVDAERHSEYDGHPASTLSCGV